MEKEINTLDYETCIEKLKELGLLDMFTDNNMDEEVAEIIVNAIVEEEKKLALEQLQCKHLRPFKRKEIDMRVIAGKPRPEIFDKLAGYKILAHEICSRAIEDYKAGIDVDENERFIRSETFELFSGMDGNEVMETLKKENK